MCRQECKTVERKQCQTVPKQQCQLVARQVSVQVPQQQCQDRLEDVCTVVPVPKCSTIKETRKKQVGLTFCVSSFFAFFLLLIITADFSVLHSWNFLTKGFLCCINNFTLLYSLQKSSFSKIRHRFYSCCRIIKFLAS